MRAFTGTEFNDCAWPSNPHPVPLSLICSFLNFFLLYCSYHRASNLAHVLTSTQTSCLPATLSPLHAFSLGCISPGHAVKEGRGLQKSSATVSDLCLLRIFLGASLSSGTQLLGECDSLLYLRQESGYPECLGVLAGLGEVARR